jgi:hypothetical protein
MMFPNPPFIFSSPDIGSLQQNKYDFEPPGRQGRQENRF